VPSTLELFDENVEARFAAVQVLDAAYLSFCHGANDIANVAGMLGWATHLES
jgi:phosphate/sulfate permease